MPIPSFHIMVMSRDLVPENFFLALFPPQCLKLTKMDLVSTVDNLFQCGFFAPHTDFFLPDVVGCLAVPLRFISTFHSFSLLPLSSRPPSRGSVLAPFLHDFSLRLSLVVPR